MRRAASKSKPPPGSPASPAVDGPRLPLWLPAVALVLMTIASYQPAWHAGFIWDDDRHVAQNQQLVAPDGLKQIWSSRESLQYYPMVFTTFRLERALWGLNPAPYHWANLLLHAGSALLLWRVLRRLGLRAAWLAAALFALHPVNVESVAWISQRKNTLAMVFYLTSVLWFLRSEAEPRASNGTRPVWYGLSVMAFVLALLSKTAVAPLPLVLLGLAWWQRGRVTRRDLWRSAPFFAASLALGLITMWFERHQTAWHIVRDDSFWSRLAGAGWAVWFYLYKALLPLNLVAIYPLWRVDATRAWSYVPGLLVVAGFLLCWRYRRSWGNAWLLCAGYFVVMLLPVLGFVNIGFMAFSLVADHWQYFAIIAPLALLAEGISKLHAPAAAAKAQSGRLAAAVLVAGLGVLTWRQCAVYADAETLWRATLTANPDCWEAHNDLGVALVGKGQVEEGISQYREAIRLRPTYADAHNNLGVALLRSGQVDEAIAQCQEAIRLHPGHVNAHNNLANALFRKGQTGEAISHYKEAIRLEPDNASAYYNLANALSMTGQTDDAIRQYQQALRLKPDLAPAHYNFGIALLQKGQTNEAAGHLQEALRLRPDYAEANPRLEGMPSTSQQPGAPASP
jgi:protein O-mannosyl-transferase